MPEYLTVMFSVTSMTTGDTAEKFTKFLNKQAVAGWAFRYAIQVREGLYLMIFEKVLV